MKSTFELNSRTSLEIETRGMVGQSGAVGICITRKAGSEVSQGRNTPPLVPAPENPSSESLIYYGPMECDCGKTIVRLSAADGAYAYEMTAFPFYPNTTPKWELHECLGSATVHVLGHDWKPSEARAVASALLSAATEAK